MNVTNTSAANGSGAYSTGSATGSADATTMGKDVFFRLLISQLQNQDPLNPSDPTEFTSQLAQFSSLEQLSNINTNLQTLSLYQASINNAQAVSLIGKEILASGNQIEKKGDASVTCEFDLGAEAKKVVVNIYDSDGNLVRTMESSSSLPGGRQSIQWDGRDKNNNLVKDGCYTFEVKAEDADKKPVSVSTLTRGKVTGVSFDGSTPVLMIGDRRVLFGNVLQIVESQG
jgi:flagellar basal-body rod modification protein FlgD